MKPIGTTSMRAMATGQVDSSAIRTETWLGREYTVVPVIALVEGVLQGLNASEPEFADAEEFGRFPQGWDGRPLVMNHPEVNGVLVSANSTSVLQDWSFGFIFNTQLDSLKLKTEAWIDNARVEELGGEVESTVQRLKDHAADPENVAAVEVSTGLFTTVVEKNGLYGSKQYAGYWTNVVPDHLAFLSEGSLGACSVADGCGAPRLNATKTSMTVNTGPVKIGTQSPTAAEGSGHCCEACAAKQGDSNMPGSTEAEAKGQGGTTEEATNAGQHGKPGEAPASTETSGTAESIPEGEEGTAEAGASEDEERAEGGVQTPEQVTEELAETQGAAHVAANLAVNSIPAEVTLENAREVLQSALRSKLGSRAYIIAMTTDVVAYYTYAYDDYCYDGSSKQMAIAYSLASDGGVTFTGEPYPVNLMVTIVPQTAATSVVANKGGSITPNSEKDSKMADEVVATPDATENGNAPGAAASPATMQSYLDSAPPEVREMLESGLKLHSQKKERLVKGLAAHDSAVYTEDELNGMSIDQLEKLTKLASPTPSFNGRAVPTGEQPGVTANGKEDKNAPPTPPKAFEYKPGVNSQKAVSRDAAAAA